MPQLATVDELIETLDLGGDNPARIKTDLLVRALDSAEKTVKQLTGRYFYPEPALVDGADTNPPVAKTFRVRGTRSQAENYCVRVRIPDLRTATEVTVNDTVVTEGVGYDFDSFEGEEPFTSIYLYQSIAYGSPFTVSSTAELSITGRWGFLEVPGDIKEAVLQIAARRYHRRNAMFADQVDTGQGAFDFRGGVHPDVQSTLRRYRPVQTALV